MDITKGRHLSAESKENLCAKPILHSLVKSLFRRFYILSESEMRTFTVVGK